MQSLSLVEQLGYPADSRLVIFHADDVGMCHGSNRAFLDLVAAGILQTGSVMIPCPWSPAILAAARANPQLDLGVHLTLTSEWPGYRWGPISTRDPASGLLDEAACFWPQVQPLRERLNVSAAIQELRSQIEMAQRAGLDFTHLDTHMGAAMMPELIATYLELGFEYGVPVLVTREANAYLQILYPDWNHSDWAQTLAQIEARGMPLLDRFIITPGYSPGDNTGGRVALYEQLLGALEPGVTYFSLHPNTAGDIEAINTVNPHWRTFEYEYLQSQRLRDFLQAQNIIPIGFRAIRDVMRRQVVAGGGR